MARKKNEQVDDSVNQARSAALDKALGDITKRFGDGTVMRLGDAHQLRVDAIPTGSLSLDIALGVGGIPRGRVTEIYGPESSGKTTVCQHIVAEAQRMGGRQPLSIWNMPSTRPMQSNVGSMWITC